MNRLMVKKDLFEQFKKLFSVHKEAISRIGVNIVEKPFIIPGRFFGQTENIAIPMRVAYDQDWKCLEIIVLKKDYDELLSYFDVYEGEFNVPMLRKVFELPSDHMPDSEASFRLVCHLDPSVAINEPKLKFKGNGDGYTIDI